jgi:hypothetical protein
MGRHHGGSTAKQNGTQNAAQNTAQNNAYLTEGAAL